MQVVFLKPANMLKRSMGKYIPIADRIALQSSSNELNRMLCHLASRRAGYLIEDFTQVSLPPPPFSLPGSGVLPVFLHHDKSCS